MLIFCQTVIELFGLYAGSASLIHFVHVYSVFKYILHNTGSGAGALGHGGARAPPTFGTPRHGGTPINVNCHYYVIANVNNKHAINFSATDFAVNCHILSLSQQLRS